MRKVETFLQKLNQRNIDLAMIINFENSSKPNSFYLSGFSGSSSILLISPDRKYIITDSRYFEQAQKETNFTLIPHKKGDIFDTLKRAISDFSFKKVGIEFERINHKTFLTLSEKICDQLVPIDDILREMRSVKDEKEIESIKKAISISEAALAETLKQIKEGMTELDIASELEFRMRKMGAERIAFETIATSGPRTSIVHGKPTNRKIRNSEPILIDFGAVVNGYCADITRTVCLGKPSGELRQIYQIVYDAQSSALNEARASMTGSDLDSIARKIISKKGFSEEFGHGLGHGLGLEVHESPGVNPRNDKPLGNNAVVTIEPGIYLPGKFGVRIEEDVVLKDNGAEVLTHYPRKLISL
ncbi:MAG: Xaa-Pro dipeptidase [Thermotogae bacterium]|nr:MAG: Xaa-Pro dipeptidase [Thermotogota bacterium]